MSISERNVKGKNTAEKFESINGTLKEVGVGEKMGQSADKLDVDEALAEGIREGGLHYFMTAFFLVAQVAGAGFLALPRAMADSGWGGAALTIGFCISVGFSGTRLGRCWVILEERWPEYRKPARQPYMDIAYQALGIHGRRFTLFCVLATLIGSVIVFIILIAGMMAQYAPVLNQCQWSVVVAAIIVPATWLGSPKDFWQASVLAVVSTVVAVIVIVVNILMSGGPESTLSEAPVVHSNPTIVSFSLAFGAILFSFGGASVFPTIQNDMKKRTDFWKSIIIAFITILALYFPVQLVAYIYIGDAVKTNVLLSVKPSIMVIIAIGMEILNLLGTYVISFNPVAQSLEDIVGVPNNFGWKRVILRSALVGFELLVALAIPDFGLVLNLIGGSTMACMSFIMPPLMYMKLVDDKSNKEWPERQIPLWERIYLWTIIGVGIVGGLSATTSALMGIISPESFQRSCFINFLGNGTAS